MTDQKQLFSRLVCPACTTPLKKISGAWTCQNGHTYPESDNGIPLLRTDLEASPVTPQGGDERTVEQVLRKDGIIKAAEKLLSTNFTPYPYTLEDIVEKEQLVLNVGGGMREFPSKNVCNLDYFLFSKIDVVGDAHSIPFADSTFDLVVSEFMIEHVQDPFRVGAELERVTRPGGHIYISYPLMHVYHSFPDDYYRFTHEGIKRLFPESSMIGEGVLSGPACRWLSDTADLISFPFDGKMAFAARALALTLLFPIKYLDYLFNRSPKAIRQSITNYCVLQKNVPNMETTRLVAGGRST